MGGRPEVALSFVGFPTDKLPLEVLAEVLAGMQDACARARCAIVGGHTIADAEPKAGLAVVGQRRSGARLVARAAPAKGRRSCSPSRSAPGSSGRRSAPGTRRRALVAAATAQMLELNDGACEVGPRAAARPRAPTSPASACSGTSRTSSRPRTSTPSSSPRRCRSSTASLELAAAGIVPGGSKRNLAYARRGHRFAAEVGEPLRLLLADAQTSGGLLLCVPEHRAAEAVRPPPRSRRRGWPPLSGPWSRRPSTGLASRCAEPSPR